MTACFVNKDKENSISNINLKNHNFLLFCSDENGEKYVFTEYLGRIAEYHVHDNIFNVIISSTQIKHLDGFIELNVDSEKLRQIFGNKKVLKLNCKLFVNLRSAYYASRTKDNGTIIKIGSESLVIDMPLDKIIEIPTIKEMPDLSFFSKNILDEKSHADGKKLNSVIFNNNVLLIDSFYDNGDLISVFLFKDGKTLTINNKDSLQPLTLSDGSIVFLPEDPAD